MNLVSFGILKLFPILMETIGLPAAVSFLAILCILGSIYITFVINETKGKSLDAEEQHAQQSENIE